MNAHTPPPKDPDGAAGPADTPADQPAGPAGPPDDTSHAAPHAAPHVAPHDAPGVARDGTPDGTPDGAPPPPPAAGGAFPEPPPLYPPWNTAGPQTPPPPPVPPAGGGPVPRDGLFEWVRRQGIARGRDRWIGGVASGIAHRIGVDPVIVRGLFVVLAVFAGVGVLLYGIAWALLPEPDGRIHVQEASAGRWSTGMTGALIATLIGLPGLGGGVWGWDGIGLAVFWSAFWVGGAIYLVYYLNRRNKAQDPGAGAGIVAGQGNYPGAVPIPNPAPGPGNYPGAVPIPSPAPGPEYPAAPAKTRSAGPGAPAVAVTAGVALLIGGTVKALDAVNVIGLGNAGNAVVWAIVAAVFGLGIIVAGSRGRTSGLLGFFAVVALVSGAILSAVPQGDRFRLQDADWAPVSIEQARAGLDITAGTGTADLTRLGLNPPLTTDVVIPIEALASNLTIVLPNNIPVRIDADMTMGNLTDGSQLRGGMSSRREYNTDQPGARLILKISGTFSNISIQERT